MESSLEEWDAAWLAGEPVPLPEASDQPPVSHPQIHALQHAAEQLRAARHWSHVDPAVQAAYRQALAALAEELRYHEHGELDSDVEESDPEEDQGAAAASRPAGVAQEPPPSAGAAEALAARRARGPVDSGGGRAPAAVARVPRMSNMRNE